MAENSAVVKTPGSSLVMVGGHTIISKKIFSLTASEIMEVVSGQSF